MAHLVCPIQLTSPASSLVRTLCSLSVQSFCQDSMHGGTPSGLDVLIRELVPLRKHWPGPHLVLHMSGTWSGHPNTTIHMGNLWEAVVHHQGWMSQWEMGCHSGVTGWSGGSDDRGLHRETYIRPLVSPKTSSYLSSISMLMSFGILQNQSWDKSIIVNLEYTSSNHAKLLDSLSDPQEPLINWIS